MDWTKLSEKSNVFGFIITAIFALLALARWLLSEFSATVATVAPKAPQVANPPEHWPIVPIVLIAVLVLTYGFVGVAHLMARRRTSAVHAQTEPSALPKARDERIPRAEPTLRAWRLKRHSEKESVILKSKLWLIFRNDGEQAITVRAPQWRGLPLQVQPYNCKCLQPEMHRGKGDWDAQHEVLEARIEPGMSFRLWIGLNPSIEDSELEKKLELVDLGKLIMPVKIGNQPESDSTYEV